jgi:hypothetical protein
MTWFHFLGAAMMMSDMMSHKNKCVFFNPLFVFPRPIVLQEKRSLSCFCQETHVSTFKTGAVRREMTMEVRFPCVAKKWTLALVNFPWMRETSLSLHSLPVAKGNVKGNGMSRKALLLTTAHVELCAA